MHNNSQSGSNENKLFMDELFTINKKNIYTDDNDNLLRNIGKDYSLLNLINDYSDTPKSKNDEKLLTSFATNNINENNDNDSENSVVFTNRFIQTSFTRMNNIKKLLCQKEKMILNHYINKWRSILGIYSYKYEDRDYLLKNRKIIENVCNNNDSHLDYLNIKTDRSNQSHSNSNNQDNSNNSITNNPLLILALKNIVYSKLSIRFNHFITNTQLYINTQKLANSNLSLLYLFTELAIARNKQRKNQGNNNNNIDLRTKLTEYEKKITKHEALLSEKASIIEKKNDTIETLSEQIEYLNNKLAKSDKKGRDLKIINEMLCHKCGNSLEESFISVQTPRNMNDSDFKNKEQELKRTIQEQLDYILKMEQECKELRSRNMEYKSKNEMIMNELEIIKIEFKNLSDNFSKNKPSININLKDISCQTDAEPKPLKTKTVSKTVKPSSTTKKYASTLNLQKDNKEKSSTNSTSLKHSHTSSVDFNSEKEVSQGLRFDNSILSQEIVGLNKEVIKYKNECKILTETNKKIEKERADLLSKLKIKTENFDKIKKENEDLMILIQTSNYKSFVTSETENKKLKQDNQSLNKEIEQIRTELLSKDKRINECESDTDKIKKINENMMKYKSERENLILENTKLDSELNRVKYDIEEMKSLLERQNILLRNKEEQITKMNEDITYLSFNAKKTKQDSDKFLQDILAYQQIVRKMEKELADCQVKKEKIENELNIIKQQMFKK